MSLVEGTGIEGPHGHGSGSKRRRRLQRQTGWAAEVGGAPGRGFPPRARFDNDGSRRVVVQLGLLEDVGHVSRRRNARRPHHDLRWAATCVTTT